MIRPALYILSKNEEMVNSLSRYIKHIGIDEKGLRHAFDPQLHAVKYRYIEEIISLLNEIDVETLMNTAVLLDVSDIHEKLPGQFHPLDKDPDSGWPLIASLILAYPEVYWILVGDSYNRPHEEPKWLTSHFVESRKMNVCIDLLMRHQNGYRTLFDPSGLRANIKQATYKEEGVKDNNARRDNKLGCLLSTRLGRSACAIDEEFPFTYLNGYTAYKYGYRCFLITSNDEFNETSDKCDIALSMEDFDLRLKGMDFDSTAELRCPGKRPSYILIDKLDPEKRYFITGQASEEEKEIHDVQIITKPYSGIYDLACKMDLIENDKKSVFNSQLEQHQTNAAQNMTVTSHSPQNILHDIADLLIRRARRVIKNIDACEDAVYGSLLSLEAKELLHGNSMTTALEALSLQHQLEVIAECKFYGVAVSIEVKRRFDDISDETDRITGVVTGPISRDNWTKKASSINTQIEIVNNVRLQFKEYEQYDEEDLCVIKVRSLLQSLHCYSTFNEQGEYSRLRRFGLRTWSRTGEKYINYLLSSGWNIVKTVAILIFIFAFLYEERTIIKLGSPFQLDYEGVFNFFGGYLHALYKSAQTFFSLQPNDIPIFNDDVEKIYYLNDTLMMSFLTLEIFLGYFHMGIFISWLYQKVSRK